MRTTTRNAGDSREIVQNLQKRYLNCFRCLLQQYYRYRGCCGIVLGSINVLLFLFIITGLWKLGNNWHNPVDGWLQCSTKVEQWRGCTRDSNLSKVSHTGFDSCRHPCRTTVSQTDCLRSKWESLHLSNTSEKHPPNTEQTIQTKIFETPAEPNTYDNPLGLQDLPRSEWDAHVDPTKESVQTTAKRNLKSPAIEQPQNLTDRSHNFLCPPKGRCGHYCCTSAFYCDDLTVVIRFFPESLSFPQFPSWWTSDVRV